MKKQFRPRLEILEQRRMLAGDVDLSPFVDLPTREDFAPEVVRQLTKEELLAVNVGWVFQGSPVLRDGDFLISRYGKKVEIARLDATVPGGARATDVFEGSMHESEVLSVHSMGPGRLLINSTVTTGWRQQETTTWFMKTEDDGTLTVLDTLEQTQGTMAWIRDDGITLRTTFGESARLPASVAGFPVFESMLDSSTRDTELVQNFVFENDRIELQTAIKTNRGVLSAFPGDDGRVLISDSGTLHIITPTENGQSVNEVEIPAGMTDVKRMTVHEDGSTLFEGTFPSPGREFGFGSQWGTVKVDSHGDVIEIWKEPDRLYSSMRSGQFNPGFPGPVKRLDHRFRNKEDGVRIISLADDQFVVDSEISLPGVTGSKAGGIRVDENQVIIVGGDYAKFREETLQSMERQHLDLTAHLLVRDESGEFTLRDSIPLTGLHFNSTAQVSDGVVTLADNNHVYILRPDGDRLSVEYVKGDGQGASFSSITGLRDINVSFDGRSIKYSLPGEAVNGRGPIPIFDFSGTQVHQAVADEAVAEFAKTNGEADAQVDVEVAVVDMQNAQSMSTSVRLNGLDVNADGAITAVDALIVLNHLANDEVGGNNAFASTESADSFNRDTNGDGQITALDALLVINHLAEAELAAAKSPATDEVGFQWDIDFGPDSPLGTDIHADSSSGATLLRSIDGQIGFESHIDRAGDVDWFTVQAETNAIHLEVRGLDVLGHDGPIRYRVFDAAGNEAMPVVALTGSGVSASGTYLTGGSNRLLVRVEGEVGRYAFELSDTGYDPNSIAARSTDANGVVNLDQLEANAREIVANYQASSLDVSPDSNRGDDRHRDSPMAATPWSADANHSRSSFIDVAGDRDMFRVYNMGGVISFSVHSDEISEIQLNAFDHEGNPIAAVREQTGDGVFGFDLSSYDFPSYSDSSGRTRHGIFVEVSAGSNQTGRYTIVRNSKGLHGVPVDALPHEDWANHVKTQTARGLGRNDDIIGFDAHGADLPTATNVELSAPVVGVSSFLDSPTDNDAFRFTAKTDEIVLALELHGDLARFDEGAVALFDASGNRLETIRPTTTGTMRHSGLEHSDSYRVVPGSEYVAIVSAEGESAFGRYFVSIESVGNVASILNVDSAINVTFSRDHLFGAVQISKDIAEVGGFLTSDDPVDLYRFSTDAINTKITVDGFGPFEMQLYDLETGNKINQETDFRWIQETLPSANDNLVRDYLLAVWNPGPDAEYSIDIELISHMIEDIDSVGDTVDAASFVDVSEQHVTPFMVSERASFHLFLGSSQDVDVYRIVANNSVTSVTTIWQDNTWARSRHLKAELIDADGRSVSLLGDHGPRDDRMKSRRLEFASEVGQTYYVRFSILEGGPLSTHVIIR